MKESGVFEGVEMSIQCFEDNFIGTLSFWDMGNFYCSSDLVDFVDSFHIECLWPFLDASFLSNLLPLIHI